MGAVECKVWPVPIRLSATGTCHRSKVVTESFAHCQSLTERFSRNSPTVFPSPNQLIEIASLLDFLQAEPDGASDFSQSFRRVAEFVQMHAKLIHERQIKAAHSAVWFFLIIEDSTGFQFAAAFAEYHNRECVRVVASGVHSVAIHEHRIAQSRPKIIQVSGKIIEVSKIIKVSESVSAQNAVFGS